MHHPDCEIYQATFSAAPAAYRCSCRGSRHSQPGLSKPRVHKEDLGPVWSEHYRYRWVADNGSETASFMTWEEALVFVAHRWYGHTDAGRNWSFDQLGPWYGGCREVVPG